MVLAVIDDLMLQSRVSAAVKASGTQIRFAGSEEAAFARAAEGPELILVDLNGRRTNPIPLVVRLAGTNVVEGQKILKDSGLPIITADSLQEAAERVVKAMELRGWI